MKTLYFKYILPNEGKILLVGFMLFALTLLIGADLVFNFITM